MQWLIALAPHVGRVLAGLMLLLAAIGLVQPDAAAVCLAALGVTALGP